MKTKLLGNENFILALSSVVLGLITGVSSGLLSLFLDFVEHTFLGFVENAAHPAAVGDLPVHRLLSVLTGGIIAAVIWWLLRSKFRSPVSVAKGIAGENMPAGEMIVHVVTQIFYVGTGGSVGRELAPREAGAMLAQKWTQLLRYFHLSSSPQSGSNVDSRYAAEAASRVAVLTDDDRKLLIAAAAGAGFAGVYIAPITGMLFCVEILLKKVSARTVTVSLTMSVIAMLVGSIVKGFTPYYLVGDVKFSLVFLIFVVIVAPICGIIGAFFRKSFQWAEKHQTHSKHILWQLPLMALITGIISMHFPQIMGNGRALAQFSINAPGVSVLGILIFGAVAKAVVTVLTIRSGAAGGTLTPSISIGAVIGVVLGLIFVSLVPGVSLAECAVLGACALLAASQQAPLMAMFMMIEICHLGYSSFLPLGLAVALAVSTSRWLSKKIS